MLRECTTVSLILVILIQFSFFHLLDPLEKSDHEQTIAPITFDK